MAPGLRQRRDVRALSPHEMTALTDAFSALKSNGQYDLFISRHFESMAHIHRGPWFLPWHRAYVIELENAMRAVGPAISIPYWRFEADAGAGLFTESCFGPDGDPGNDYRVLTGPFANWQALIYDASAGSLIQRPTNGLVRRLGQIGPLPSAGDIASILAKPYAYDTFPWNTSSAKSFRNLCEGVGVRGHNDVHRFVGGDMAAATSPNDPVFFLIHANIDRIWNVRQRRYGLKSNDFAGPKGRRIHDRMPYLLSPTTPADVMNVRKLGYKYVG